MATQKSSDSGSGGTGAAGAVGRGKGKRQTRAERGLPDLTPAQTLAKAQVQGAQNACNYIKQHIDRGNMVSPEVLQACSTLTGSLANMLGE